ncbi:class I SAM-dependent methyltransferase [Lewinella sp. W8]|uniref:class I SAM-dependent methyltransferase n=1 Tax=Lewinella sp. W8 TaxID=2528208 RepID=UPI001067C873|nr:class I SAM-dependent methyltransferase [Lewinella sp. W8]MTB53170.1 methyltransferase domain-containing protein [Lewinella sp. W8]
MKTFMNLAQYVHPITKKPIVFYDNWLRNGEGEKCAFWDTEYRRLDWIKALSFPGLDDRVLKEISKYDDWASGSSNSKFNKVNLESFSIVEQPIYKNSETLRKSGLNLQKTVKGKKILDIGGSCIDTWRFLAAGASSVEQIEVSANSQKLGFNRIQGKLGESERITFHTCPAEFLPFRDESFDLVFSRSSIHHTMRSQSIPEIHRVLRKNGMFLFFEPTQTRFFNALMHTTRKIRHVDRGTDDPLTIKDFRLLKKLFRDVSIYPESTTRQSWQVAISWVGLSKKRAPQPILFGYK